jgi:hypothetical protein
MTAPFDATPVSHHHAPAVPGTAGNLTIDAGAPIKAGGNVSLNAAATIANGDTVTALNGNAALTAAADINNNGLVIAVKNDAVLGAGGTINNPGGVSAGHDARLTAGNNINTSGNVSAGHNSVLTAGANIAETGGVITAAGRGAAGAPSVALTAQTGSISQSAGAIISATDASAGDLAVTAAVGSRQRDNDRRWRGGRTPSVALTAQAGSISQGAGAIISATNTTSGDLALTVEHRRERRRNCRRRGAARRRCTDRAGRVDQPGCWRGHLGHQQHFGNPARNAGTNIVANGIVTRAGAVAGTVA